MINLTEKKIVMFLGAFGSGKTELAVNYAMQCKSMEENVALIDFDLVTPYFRVRDVNSFLTANGVNVIQPAKELLGLDLPVFSPNVLALLKNPEKKVIFDVGGDDIGARPVGCLAKELGQKDYDAFLVVNTNRPFTKTEERIIGVLQAIEDTAGIRISGFISNTHLQGGTKLTDIIQGYEILNNVAKSTNIPIKCVVSPKRLINEIREVFPQVTTIPLKRYLLLPWEVE